MQGDLAQVPHRLIFDPKELVGIKKAMLERMAKFHDLMHSDIPLARQAFRKLLNGPVKCVPVIRDGRKDYAVQGETRLGALLTPASVTLASRRGFEPRLPP